MDIVRFKGGLGNQMFQYALLKALSAKGRDVRGSLGYYINNTKRMSFSLTDVFNNISISVVEESIFDGINKKWRLIKEDKAALEVFKLDYENRFFWVEELDGKYNENIFKTKNCTFVGYWQTEKYFQEIKSELHADFNFSRGDSKFEKLKNKISSDERYISVHIRRGDYLKAPEIYENLQLTQYYKEAMKYMESQVDNPVYVYVSDDIQWVKANVNDKRGIFIDANMFDEYQDWYDMCLMSCCTNNIIANSSFSWWGAWLNRNPEKIVIAPKKWLNGCDTPDIWCNGWIRM